MILSLAIFFCLKLWEVPSFRFGDVYDVGPGSKILDGMAGRVRIEKKSEDIWDAVGTLEQKPLP